MSGNSAALLEALAASDCRILGPNDLDAKTLEHCAKIAQGLQWTPGNDTKHADIIQKITADWGRRIADAIRESGKDPQ